MNGWGPAAEEIEKNKAFGLGSKEFTEHRRLSLISVK